MPSSAVLKPASWLSIRLVATGAGICRLEFERPAGAPSGAARHGGVPEADPVAGRLLAEAARQLEEYFAGRRRHFDLPLDVTGTEFQRRVWKAVSEIPYGQTMTYAQLAAHIGSPRAFRAVGAANGANPVSILVPCHRVVASGGGLGGYSGGLDLKKRLLALETGLGFW